jgi:SAM-dependent methyltransferase
VARRVSYSAIDATRIPYDGHFDVIALKSVLGGIAAAAGLDSAAQAVREIYKALRPGGRFLIAENLRATRVHMFCRRRLQRRNESEWRYFTIEEMRRLLDDFSSVEYSARGFLGTFGRTERQRAILGRIDRLLHPWLPERLKYIFFGVAVK